MSENKDNMSKIPERNPNNKKQDNNNNNLFKGGNRNTIWIILAVVGGFFLLQYISSQETAVEISQLRFENKMMSLNAVEKVNVVNREKVEVFIKRNFFQIRNSVIRKHPLQHLFSGPSPNYYFTIGSVEVLKVRWRSCKQKLMLQNGYQFIMKQERIFSEKS
jgi:hypothetical protein